MDTEDLRLGNIAAGDGDDDSLDNLPQIKSHRSIGKNMVFSKPPAYVNGRFSSQGKNSRMSSSSNSDSTAEKKVPLPEEKADHSGEVYDPETGMAKKLKNNFVGVSSGKSVKTCLCIVMAFVVALLFLAFVIYTAIRLQNEKCPDDYICWGEAE